MAVGAVAQHSPGMPLTLLLSLSTGCDDRVFDPPAEPRHNIYQEGYGHAKGYNRPYLCRDEADNLVTCPTDGQRPAPDKVSCDAAGCHGIMQFDSGLAFEDRDLYGSDGPGCFTCHGREWSNTMVVE